MDFDLGTFIRTNWPDIIALITGILGVWLTIKQNIWCWPMALLSVLISAIVFYQQRLFGDLALQVFYFFAGIYGWYYWNKKKHVDFKVQKTNLQVAPLLIIVTLLQALVYYKLLILVKGNKPFLDALLTAGSLTATYMMTKKWLANWLVWVLIDGIYVFLYASVNKWMFSLLYLVFTFMALYGWLKWRKTVS